MKKARGFLCVIVALAMIFASCEDNPIKTGEESSHVETASRAEAASGACTEAETDFETESEIGSEAESDPIVMERVKEVVSFVNYNNDLRSEMDLKTEGDAAVSFTVPEEGELKEFYLNLNTSVVLVACNFEVNLYKFNGDYADSVKSEPLYHEQITASYKSYTLRFEDGSVPAGDYLLVVGLTEGGNAEYTSVMKDGFWNPNNLPKEYEKYNMQSYADAKPSKKRVLCCGMTVECYAPVTEKPVDADGLDTFDEKTAKVILLAGQSNAVGVSLSSLLQKRIRAEKYETYLKGYSNVKILYRTNGVAANQNCSRDFVDVKLGQGESTAAFGPEIGLAEYLTEAYPGETFYIIKYAAGGTNTFANWNVKDPTRNNQLVGFQNTIDDGLALLEADGLDPKIVGFLWMQGEGDSVQFLYAHSYYERERALVEHIRSTYADYAPASGIQFIDAAVNDSGMFATWFTVNAEKRKLSMESADNYYIDTVAAGLTTLYENNDPAHYDSLSMLLLGRLFGDKLAYALDGDEDDGICPHRNPGRSAEDYKIENDTHITVCELCGDLLTEEAHTSVEDDVVYDAEAKSYKGTCICGADLYQDLLFVSEARSTDGGSENLVISKGAEDGEDFVRYTQNGANSRARVYLFFGNTAVTGQYLVLKYRFANHGADADLKNAFVASALSANPLARGNGDACGNIGTLIGDGDWHYLVVDLVSRNAESNGNGANLQIIADENGDYAIKYIRADFTTATADGSCYLDVGYVGFADELGATEKFAK